MKICTRCHAEKTESEFHLRRQTQRGSWCKSCIRLAVSEYRIRRDPVKVKARKIAWSAKESGVLTTQACEICSSTNAIQMHHEDYSKPLKVKWLCEKCHRQFHASSRSIKHPSEWAYRKGCRCSDCRTIKRDIQRYYRKKSRLLRTRCT